MHEYIDEQYPGVDYRKWPRKHITGFHNLFNGLMCADLYFPDGVSDINDAVFFNDIYEKYILPNFTQRTDTWQNRMIQGLKYVETLSHLEAEYIWEGMNPPFDFHEDQWQKFLRTIRKRLEAIG